MKKSTFCLLLSSMALHAAPLLAQNLEETPTETGETPAEPEAPKSLYIPTNPKAAAYLLSRLSNTELLAAPSVEPVFFAILGRKGLTLAQREAALAGLVKLHSSDRVAEIFAALERNDAVGADAAAASLDLAKTLAKAPPEELRKKDSSFETLLENAAQPATRAAASVALMAAGGPGKVEAFWTKAAQNPRFLSGTLAAIPLLADAQLLAKLEEKIAPLAEKTFDPEIQRLAILALPAIKGQEPVNFKMLGTILRTGGAVQAAAVEALLAFPESAWPSDQIAPVAQAIAEQAVKFPTSDRTQPAFLDLVKLGTELSGKLPPAEGKSIRKILGGLAVPVLTVKTLVEQMLFDKSRLVVEAGKPVEVHFENPDSMPHNFVVTAPGAHQEVAALAEKLPATPDQDGLTYVPKTPKVIAATRLVEPGQKVRISFVAPKEPGDYEFVCTFPGHAMRMFGKFVVTKDLEDYLAKNGAAEEIKMTQYQAADFPSDLAQSGPRNAAAGKELTHSLGCIACHQIGGEGMAFGPDLAIVFPKYKNDAQQVVEQILEPSKIIDEKYRPYHVMLADGSMAMGIVASETADTITFQAGPGALMAVKKADIKSRAPQDLSPMPAGLLSSLKKDQVLDLLAYLKLVSATK